MPLPLIPVGAVAVSAATVGVKKIVSGIKKISKAKKTNQQAQEIYLYAENRLKSARTQTAKSLDELGKAKLMAWSYTIPRFVSQFEKLKNIEVSGGVEVEQIREMQDCLGELKKISIKASEVVGGGLGSLGAGALAGFGSYGGAMLLASASTGTSIASLSGAAATNATLAWFGGGSLATGGLGISGGIAILGGIVAVPVLMAGGLVFNAKARKQLAQAKSNLELAQKAAAEMRLAVSSCNSIKQLADQFIHHINLLDKKTEVLLDEFENIILAHENDDEVVDYTELNGQERKQVHLTLQAIQVLKSLLETSLLSEDGAIRDVCEKVLKKASTFESTI